MGGSHTNVPQTDDDKTDMLRTIGVSSVDELFADIPGNLLNPAIEMPSAKSESEVRRLLGRLAEQNADAEHHPLFLGAGAYNHFIPAVVPYLTGRGEFSTPYTPYQPEVSQGTLQSIFEFQSLVCRLTGMDVANASLYDGATAVAEAAIAAVTATRRTKIVLAGGLHPEYKQVIHTYTSGRQLTLIDLKDTSAGWPGNGSMDLDALKGVLDDNTACLVVQNPNFFGCLEDLAVLGQLAHEKGALFVVSAYPIALGLLPPPGDYGADIVVGEGQCLGNALNYGGPYLGLFSCKQKYVRFMPGRLVGAATDDRGQTGYVLTLQAREQHIRREKAGSNVCTNEALCALAATIYLSVLGPKGLRAVAEQCLQKAHRLAGLVSELPGFSLAFEGPFFNEFVVRCPVSPSEINTRLLEEGIIGGLDLGRWYQCMPDAMLLCATEMNSEEEIERLIAVLRGYAGSSSAV